MIPVTLTSAAVIGTAVPSVRVMWRMFNQGRSLARPVGSRRRPSATVARVAVLDDPQAIPTVGAIVVGATVNPNWAEVATVAIVAVAVNDPPTRPAWKANEVARPDESVMTTAEFDPPANVPAAVGR